MLHRTRQLFVRQRTALINAIRAHLAEFGITAVLLTISFLNFFTLGTVLDGAAHITLKILLLLTIIAGFTFVLGWRARAIDHVLAFPFPQTEPTADDAPLVAAIKRALAEDQIYPTAGLTISGFAQSLGYPEHQVRRAVNGALGYRNFNQILNDYRIAETSRRLTATDTRRLPVLSIALDVGYGSLAPFNKAFKRRHRVRPTDYRRRFFEGSSIPRK